MRYRTLLPLFVMALALPGWLPSPASAQTATTTTVSGTVTDTNGAAIASATVKLTDTSTNTERTATTNSEGQYNFYAAPPGLLKVTVNAQGFKTKVVTDIQASATIVATVNVVLDVGGVGEVVQVTAGIEAQLQTADSSVGSVFDESRMRQLPNINRQANSLFALQPATTPTGEFAGSRSDQTVINLDGIDVSDNVIGSTFRTIMPVPIDTIEEFRGTSANANATFGRSAGGQLSLVTKSGTNELHGSAYLYHQDGALSANSWTLNRLPAPNNKKPFLLDNRFGGTVGGPVFKDRTFFFVAYEGRRNPRAQTVTRIVPTDSLKAGTLRFRDAAGNVQTLDSNAIKALDPRGIGASPKSLEYLRLYPAPNDLSAAGSDGLNTGGFVFPAPLVTRNDFGLAKLDHKFTEKWSFSGKFSANREINTNAGQVDIQNKRATGNSPQRPRNAVATLTGVLTPTITNQASFSWLHDRLDFSIISPQPYVGLNAAINMGDTLTSGGVLDDIVDVDTQRARHQFRTLNIYQWADTLTWTKGSHNIQAGANIRRIRSVDFRDDKVIGSITTPVANVGADGFVTVTDSLKERPAFLQAADNTRFNNLYISLLGIVSQTPALITRDASLKLQPLGTGLFTKSTLGAYEFYSSDTWRWKPSLTVTYGLTYNWQSPPIEDSGKQTVIAARASGQLLSYHDYIRNKRAAAERGEVFNPELAYLPLKDAGRNTAYDTDYRNFSPRLSAAWNPSFKSGLLGKIFGDRSTVVRGGYSLVYDRTNTVQTIIIPTLGVGFAQTVNVTAPKNAAGQPFRIGVDGPIPLPTAPQQISSPVIPSSIGGYGETLSFSVDPFIKVPKNHVVNFTIQRELPWRLIMEVGYIGRFARDLYMNGNWNSVPINFKDPKSGQTFAQAFDAVATYLRAPLQSGETLATRIAAMPAQPYFENLYGAVFGANATRAIATARSGDFTNGLISNLSQIYLDGRCRDTGLCQAQNNLQSQDLLVRFSGGYSNYHGMILTMRKRFSRGLAFDFNYTLSKSIDNSGVATQNNVAEFQNSLFPEYDYGPSLFDIRHIYNGNATYELPFGKGRKFDSQNSVLNKIIGGWTTAVILTRQSGLPLTVAQNAGQAFGGGSIGGFIPTSGAIPLKKSLFDPSVHSGVNASGSAGTSGNAANRGSGLNIFANPQEVFNSFRPILLAQDMRHGRNVLRGLSRWTFDWTVSKQTNITEKIKFTLGADFINAFNHPIFNNPTLNLQTPANFGVITSQLESLGGATNGNIGPRRVQVYGRFDF